MVEVDHSTLQVKGRQLETVNMSYDCGRTCSNMHPQKFTWTAPKGALYVPTEIKKWAMYGYPSKREYNIQPRDLE